MDSSNKENSQTDKLLAEELESDEKEHPVIEELCPEKESMLDILVKSPVKRKSESCFEVTPKRNKESNGNLTNPNMQGTVSSTDHLKDEKHSSTETLPRNKNEAIKEGIIKADQSTNKEENAKTSKETYSETLIGASKSNCSSIFDQSENDKAKIENIIDQKGVEIDRSSKYETKIIEKNETDEKELSKFQEIEETLLKCKKLPLDPLISSPVKRKPPQTEHEVKRKLSTDNVLIEENSSEILTGCLNVQDAASYIDSSEKHLASAAVLTVNTTEESLKEKDMAINQSDKSAVDCRITETTCGTDSAGTSKSEISNIIKSSEHSSSDEALSQQAEIMRESRHRRSIGLGPLEDLEKNPEFVNNQKQILESMSHQRQSNKKLRPESDNEKRKLLGSFKNKDSKTKIDSVDKDIKDDLPVEKIENDQIEHSEVKEICPEKELLLDKPVKSPEMQKFELHFEINPNLSTDNLGQESNENSTEVGFEVPTEDDYEDSLKQIEEKMIRILEDYFRILGIRNVSPTEYETHRKQLERVLKKDPSLIVCYPENPKLLAEEIAIARLIQEMRENDERTVNTEVVEDRSPDTLPVIRDPHECSDSTPSENQPENTSETNSSNRQPFPDVMNYLTIIFREMGEYNIRQQNNRDRLQVNCAGDRPPTPIIKTNIESEENRIQIIGYPRTVTRSTKDIVDKEYEDSNHLFKDEDLEKRKSTDKLFEISASTSENKRSSIETKNPIEVKDKHGKVLDKETPESANSSTKKIQTTDFESINRPKSNSPQRRNDKSKPPPTLQMPKLEGLAARISDTLLSPPPASPTRSFQPPASPTRSFQPPASPTRSFQPPALD